MTTKFPKKGQDEYEILYYLREVTKNDQNDLNKNANILKNRHDYIGIVWKAYLDYLAVNIAGLESGSPPGIFKIHKETIEMIADFLGSPKATGDVLTGGHETNIMAEWAALQMHKDKNNPNIVAPQSLHTSLEKGAKLMKFDIKTVPVDKETWIVDPKIMEEKIDDNTVAIVGSYGTCIAGQIDPIPELSRIAEKHGVNLHVDGAWGTFILPFFKKLGVRGIPDFDFRLSGVSTVNGDPHKMLGCPWGSGILMYKNDEMRDNALFKEIFKEGKLPYTTSGLGGSRSGAPIVATWALIKYYGEEGYLRLAKKTLEIMGEIKDFIQDLDGMELMVEPKLNQFWVKTEGNVVEFYEEMKKRDWHMFFPSLDPPALRFGVTHHNAPKLQKLLKDFKEVNESLSKKITKTPEKLNIDAYR